MTSKHANQIVPEVVDHAGVRAEHSSARDGTVVLASAAVAPTQIRRPWRSTVRTVFQALVGLAAMAPLIYHAATNKDPALAGGWAALALGISAGVTRVMGTPGVEKWLRRFLPFLAAAPKPKS